MNQTLTVGTTAAFTTLDPNQIDTSMFPFRNAVFDPLIDIPVVDIPTYKLGSIQDWLATAHSANSDYTQITLPIRTGVKFHDGKTMTVDDVVNAFQHALDPKTGRTMAGTLGAVAKVEAKGDSVVLTTSGPSVDALYRLTLFRMQSPTNYANATNHPIGTGPFKFVEYVPGDHLTLERNTDYWKPIASNVKQLIFRFYSTAEAMVNAALGGQIDILQFGNLKDASTLQKQGWSGYAAPIADFEMMVLNYADNNDALKNQQIRQAISLSIDRDSIVKNVYYNLVKPIIIPMPPSNHDYDPSTIQEWQFNLSKAAQLVKASGISNPTFQMGAASNDPNAGQIAQIIASDLAKVGITAQIQLMDSTTQVTNALKGDFQSNVYACSVGVPNVQDFEDCSVYRPNVGPFSGPKALPNYVTAYQAAAVTVNPADRTAAFKKVFEALLEDAWAIPICTRGLLCGQASHVSGVSYDAKTHLVYQNIVKG
ncbi:MAG TPA: ABC transporter substrate-binding protein [Candidatus Micrarchaeaceae archaeon]|nr:ABC transporter substrate-binding protein [Candidatus Micrarchaeaceae archaeon]